MSNSHAKDLLRWSQVPHSKGLSKLPVQSVNLLSIMGDDQHVIHVEWKDDELTICICLHELARIYSCLAVSMINRESNSIYHYLGASSSPYKLFFNSHAKLLLPSLQIPQFAPFRSLPPNHHDGK